MWKVSTFAQQISIAQLSEIKLILDFRVSGQSRVMNHKLCRSLKCHGRKPQTNCSFVLQLSLPCKFLTKTRLRKLSSERRNKTSKYMWINKISLNQIVKVSMKMRNSIVNLKNSHNLKVELCFICWELLGLQTSKTVSQVTLRELLQGGEGRSQVL